jgi:hypothetical protein
MTGTFVFHVDEPFPEGATPKFQLLLEDEDGVALTAALTDTLTLSVIDARTEAVVNGRDQQSILNANGGSLDGAGNFALQTAIADLAILDAASTYETRKLVVTWEYAGNTKRGGATWVIRIANRFKT